jgi:hypothetical protein
MLSLTPRHVFASVECLQELLDGQPQEVRVAACADWYLQVQVASQLGLDTKQISATFNFPGELKDGTTSLGMSACVNEVKLMPVVSAGDKLETSNASLQASHSVGLGTLMGPSGSVDVQYHAMSATVNGARMTAVTVMGVADMGTMALAQAAVATGGGSMGGLMGFVDPNHPRHALCIGQVQRDVVIALKARLLVIAACLAAAAAAFVIAMYACQAMLLIPLLWVKALACMAVVGIAYKLATLACTALAAISIGDLIVDAVENYKRCLMGL